MTFGLKVKLYKNTSFDFELKGDLDDKTIENSLNKVLGFLENQQLNNNYKQPDYVFYEKINNTWVKVDVEKEIRKKILNGKMNKK